MAKLQFGNFDQAANFVRSAMNGEKNAQLRLYDFSNLTTQDRNRLATLAVELENKSSPFLFARQAVKLNQSYFAPELRQILLDEILKS